MLQRFSLLHVNAVEAVLCAAAGFCVGHAKDVVSFNALVAAAVAWDGIAQVRTSLLGVDAVEGAGSVIVRLLASGLLLGPACFHEAGLVVGDVIVAQRNAVELVNLRRRNWL